MLILNKKIIHPLTVESVVLKMPMLMLHNIICVYVDTLSQMIYFLQSCFYHIPHDYVARNY